MGWRLAFRDIVVLLFAAAACRRPADSTAAPPEQTPAALPTTPIASATAVASASAAPEESADPDAPTALWGREDHLPDTAATAVASANVVHHRHAPTVRQGTTQVSGRLPPEVIQRIVRQNFGRFRLCYEEGLRRNPKLEGRVVVKFVIDATGNVKTVDRDAANTLADPGTVACVKRGFTNLSFPAPEGGIVTVVYPLIFEPPTD